MGADWWGWETSVAGGCAGLRDPGGCVGEGSREGEDVICRGLV